MEGGRFLVSAQALAAVLAIVGIGERSYRVALVGMLVVLQIGGMVRFAHGQSNGTPVWATPVSPVPTSASVAGTYSWLEHQDRVHLRDTTTVRPLERVVAQLHARLHRPVTIASGQAGMVAYYTFQKDFGRARFIDTNSLASDRFSRCPELLRHTTLGAHITYGAWFAHTARCRVPLPDVVLDTYDPARDPALKEHYDLAYAQRGPITTSSSLLPGYSRPCRPVHLGPPRPRAVRHASRVTPTTCSVRRRADETGGTGGGDPCLVPAQTREHRVGVLAEIGRGGPGADRCAVELGGARREVHHPTVGDAARRSGSRWPAPAHRWRTRSATGPGPRSSRTRSSGPPTRRAATPGSAPAITAHSASVSAARFSGVSKRSSVEEVTELERAHHLGPVALGLHHREHETLAVGALVPREQRARRPDRRDGRGASRSRC